MAGIYIHIPFCRKACHYCNFHFSTAVSQTGAMVGAIRKEAALRRSYINEPVSTIYFGGGTPSLLQSEDLNMLLVQLHSSYEVDQDAEITIEANPDDITEEKLAAWKCAGVNRLSIGIQSFIEEDLRWMNRAHNASQALASILAAQRMGFSNISIDLIYGTPTLGDDHWQHNVEMALSLELPHLSCYALTVEPKTALDKMIALGRKEGVDPEKQGRHFELLMQWMEDAGYEHYEISNFAKPGQRSRHNSSYWQGRPYIGLGPSAHSYDGESRQWNVSSNALYLTAIEQDRVPFEREKLTMTQQLNEYIMTSLRTIEGLSLQTVDARWNSEAAKGILTVSERFFRQALMFERDGCLLLTKKGRLFADGIAADLFAPYATKV